MKKAFFSGQLWQCKTVLPATWEADIAGLRFHARLGRMLVRTYFKSKLAMTVLA
jgi:hypothetical protein